jgi:hypothetical protein
MLLQTDIITVLFNYIQNKLSDVKNEKPLPYPVSSSPLPSSLLNLNKHFIYQPLLFHILHFFHNVFVKGKEKAVLMAGEESDGGFLLLFYY